MQSGITASAELLEAFTTFTSDTSAFCLPVSITSESLTPLSSIPFPSGSSRLSSSVSSLDSLLTPTTPLYLLLRRGPTGSQAQSDLVAVTYIPSRAPVRQKTLFASTRATLIRELGSEKFGETVFLTEREEVLDPAQWDEGAGGGGASAGAGQGQQDPGLLSTEERELQAVKRAEEEERHGTRGRDLMGEAGSGGVIGARTGTGGGRSGIVMKIDDDARAALGDVAAAAGGASGLVVQMGIEVSSETLTLLGRREGVSVGDVAGMIPGDRPSYTFYSVGSGVVFLYVCPLSSKVKERMVYAGSRRGLLHIAEGEGVKVLKRLEAGDPDEGSARLEEEVRELVKESGAAGGDAAEGEDSAPGSGTATPRGGFARPKRPGRR
ncbi:Twinfilin-1 [Exophiala xenobiotica]|nr:Twinfilin-1 [Exophiala xenobiotica]KAK5558595.1 Twinfilin-1 [Exophiala xenobiotica]